MVTVTPNMDGFGGGKGYMMIMGPMWVKATRVIEYIGIGGEEGS